MCCDGLIICMLDGKFGVYCLLSTLAMTCANFSLSGYFLVVAVAGTMGELTPVNEIDGRMIGYADPDQQEGGVDFVPGEILKMLQVAYRQLTATQGYPLPF